MSVKASGSAAAPELSEATKRRIIDMQKLGDEQHSFGPSRWAPRPGVIQSFDYQMDSTTLVVMFDDFRVKVTSEICGVGCGGMNLLECRGLTMDYAKNFAQK